MSSLSNIIDYFKSCYQVDFKAVSILNFLGNKVENQLILNSADLLNGKLMQYPVDSAWGKEMETTLALHGEEKTLFCTAFFLSGKMNVIGRSQKVFAPLYIYPTSLLYEHEVYYLVVDAENAMINPVFLEFIKSQTESSNITYDILDKALPKGYIQFDQIHQIEVALKKLIPGLDMSDLGDFPNLFSETALKTIYKKRSKDTSFSLLPAIGVGLVNKPSGSRGILNELTKMLEQKKYSKVISDLFKPPSPKINKKKPSAVISPVTLSNAQLEVFESYQNHRISMVVGPPGTGKSFTIAALAVDLISRGKTVLIASKNHQAGNVIAHKIEHDFGLKGVVVKTSNSSFLKTLHRQLDNISHGLDLSKINQHRVKLIASELTALHQSMNAQEKIILKRSTDEMKWGAFFHKYQDGFFQRYRKSWIKFKLDNSFPLWQLMFELDKLYLRSHKQTKKYIRKNYDAQLYATLREERLALQTLIDALKSDTGALMQGHFDKLDFKVILHALPAWIVSAPEIHNSLPLTKELFDVVIIDEATQCDIASSLPLLQRAKKAMIVGDPKQLRHISFLSDNQQKQFAKKHKVDSLADSKINYRKNSLLDLASKAIPSQDQVHFLDEHYRSMPDIIDFSNQNFYNNRLKIMTATPLTLKEKSVFLHKIAGKRNTKGQNEIEADTLIEMVKKIIDEESELDKNLHQSIGILSPFRTQVNLIKTKIRKAIDLKKLKQHQLLIGTPYQFQGEERDVMLLSFAVDNETHPSTYIYLNKPDIFNVSITRARSLQHAFISVHLEQLNPDYLFSQFLHQANSQPLSDSSLSTYESIDPFLEEVVAVLNRWKVDQIHKAYPIAGIEIDIVVVHKKKSYCIDLVGFPGDFEERFPLERWKMLERMGVQTFTLPYSSWYIDRDKTRNALRKWLFPNGLKG